jgi:hypothetical protein
VGQLGFSSLPAKLRPLPEARARTLAHSVQPNGDARIRAAVRAAKCGFHDGAAARDSRICSLADGEVPAANQPRISRHRPSANFDPTTLVTTASATLTVHDVPEDLWRMLALGSDPQNWSKAAPDYFKESSRQEKGLKADKNGPNWNGLLHERFEWNWNPDSSARYENMLKIDYQVGESEVRVDYWLEECLSTDFGFGEAPGGLDVDDGALVLKREGTTVTSTATKSLRYTDPPDAPDGLVLMLSYVTPATLGLWLDSAVYNAVHQTILDWDPWNGGKRPPDLTPPSGGGGSRRPEADSTVTIHP